MKQVYLYSWAEGSVSARALAEALGIKRIRHKNSAFTGSIHKKVLNWGASNIPEDVRICKVINEPVNISRVSNKLTFFEMMTKAADGPRVPPFTTNPAEALKWYETGSEVVARHVLNGHSGNGIGFLSDEDDQHFEAKLFTKYIKKEDEYRVHIVQGKVIDIQKKKLRTSDDAGNRIDPTEVDFRVRSHANGFIFAREGVEAQPDVVEQAMKAMAKSNLTFGAVDVIWNNKSQKAYVLEINTAPGLEGQTVTSYAEALKGIL